MNFIKRALLWSKAKKGRTLLLCAVFSAILIFVLAGITIRSAALRATENAKKSVGSTVTLGVNREQQFKKDSSSEKKDPSSFKSTPIPLETVQKIAKLSNVKSYTVTATTSAGAGDGIEPISSSDSTSESSTEESSDQQHPAPPMQETNGDFKVTGVLASANSSEFSSGTAKLVSGKALTASDRGSKNVLIEKALAEANSLSVGDTFQILDSNQNSVKVTIKGIYETTNSGNDVGRSFNFMNPANTIYCSYTLVNQLKNSDSVTVDSAVYTLKDPQKTTAFVKQAKKLIDTKTYTLTSNDQLYQTMLTPMNNVASFVKNIVLLVAIAGMIILTLIVMMAIRERRYEIGVLLSLGESRLKIIMQFFVEVVLCMVVALLLASVSGKVVGNVVGEQLLAQQQTQTSDQKNSQNATKGERKGGPGGEGGPGIPSAISNLGASSKQAQKSIEKLNITLQPRELLTLTGIGLLISLISILCASIGLLYMEPKRILTN